MNSDSPNTPRETQFTAEDYDDTHDDGCWNCDGEGYIADCFDGFCLNAEDGCDLCTRRCDVCNPLTRKAPD